MFTSVANSVIRSSLLTSTRFYATQKVGKVAVLGAAGGIGQPLSLLLKNEPEVTHLNLYDIVNAVGVTADLSHISSPAKVSGFGGDDLDKALQGAEVVVIPAGVPRKPGMTRDDLFNTNASIVKSLAEACAKNCPEACLLIISNPVNSTVPIVAETLKKHGVYNKNKLFGVTTLDVTRAKTFISELKGADVSSLDIPVVGGHAGTTIVPILSKNTAGVTFTDEERDALTKRIQFGGDEVVKAKDGAGSATLSMAYAGAQFTLQLLRALNGAKDIVECSFVESTVTDSPFFATEIKLGVNGVEEIKSLPELTSYEKELVDSAVPDLIKSVEKGVEFVKNN